MSSSAEPFEFGTLEPLATLAGGGGDRTLEEILDDLRGEARAEGFEAGRQEALAALEPAMQSLADALQGAGENAQRFLEDAERSAVELALALTRKMVGAAFEVQPELVLEAVPGALRRTTGRDHLVLEVNPDDFELVRDAADGVAARIGGIRRMDVVAERRIARGGCVVRTEEGEIDAQIEEQLTRAGEIAADLLRVRGDG
jgi:flagellar biosynthesis/type III secretory pathway protein FliH